MNPQEQCISVVPVVPEFQNVANSFETKVLHKMTPISGTTIH